MHSGDGDSFLSDIPENFEYDQNYLYDALVQSTDDYIYVCNMDTGVFRYPKAMVEEFGLPGKSYPMRPAFGGRMCMSTINRHSSNPIRKSSTA